MEEFLINIASQSPLVGILAWVIYHLKGDIKEQKAINAAKDIAHEKIITAKDEEIKELNELIRDDQKESVKVISAMTDILKAVERKIDYGKQA